MNVAWCANHANLTLLCLSWHSWFGGLSAGQGGAQYIKYRNCFNRDEH